MVPAICEVDMSHSDAVEKLLWCRDTHLIDVAHQLFNIVETPMVLTYSIDGFTGYLDLEPVGSLVRLECYVRNDKDAFLPLTLRSAQTLQTLELHVTDMPDISGLIRDPDSGEYVEYSRLQKLRIYMIHDTTAPQKLIFNGAVPFPSLRRLNIDRICPFDDDVLFRGNRASLESFSVTLLPATVAMLQRYNVFTPTSHPKLQCVDIQPPLQETINLFSSAATYMQFVLSIAPKSSVRRIYDLIDFGKALQPALALLGNHTTIQVPSILNVSLSIWDAFDLIKSLPLLSDLRAAATTLEELPQGIDMTELPEYVRSTYTPMGVRFRCWVIGYRAPDINQELATCMLLLALACPNFDYAAVDHSNRKPFMKAVREKIAEPGFTKYAPRLERLLFDGWTGCEVDSDSDSDTSS
ncbi:hypothetical protein GGF42_004598, partial [Coemansia sp. RSA 2424]